MSNDLYENIYNEYCRMFPTLANQTLRYEPFRNFVIKVFLDDGDERYYDGGSQLLSAKLTRKSNETDNEFFKRTLAMRLSFMMINRGYTQTRLAEETGIDQRTISSYLCEVSIPSIKNINIIAKTLKCSIEELIN